MKRFLTLATILIQMTLPVLTTAQEKGIKQIYFSFPKPSREKVDEISRIISIDNVTADSVFAFATTKSFSAFLELGCPYTLLPDPLSLLKPEDLGPAGWEKSMLTTWNYYPNYQQYLDFMNGFAANYPDICKLIPIGLTTQGRQLLAVKISDNVNEEDAEPQVLFSSSIHGDELTGYVMMLHLIDYLLLNYGTVDRITGMVNTTELFICPLANPDGTFRLSNNSVNTAWRYNANGIDLNRNYPDPADGPHPDGEEWQAETVAFMAFADSNHFTIGQNLHGGISILNYPWDTWSRLTADDDWWRYVCREYVDTVHLYSPANYYSQYDNGITNGYAWYRITGGRQDYMNYFHHCREVTNEISEVNTPAASLLPNFWEYNYRSFLNYIEQANYGAHGLITDSVTGEPLEAKVFIFGHDADNSFVYSKLPSGYYSRYLYEGIYDISYSCSGYFSKVVKDVSVFNRQRTVLDVQLVPLNIGSVEQQTTQGLVLYPNPARESVRVFLPGLLTGKAGLIIMNSQGKTVKTDRIDAVRREDSFLISTENLEPGLYVVRISTDNGTASEKLVIH